MPDIDILDIPFDDSAVWDMICAGETKGCFQIESNLGKKWCKRLKPRTLTELSDLVSIIRPGCVAGDTLIHTDIGRRKKISELEGYRGKICSLDTKKNKIVRHYVDEVFHTGKQRCYKVYVHRYITPKYQSYTDEGEFTLDHEFLTPDGYVPLSELKAGDRIALLDRVYPSSFDGSYYREICYRHYDYSCAICDRFDVTLDVHHISNTSELKNRHPNLLFVCPNCHRQVTEGKYTFFELKKYQQPKLLPQHKKIRWGTFVKHEFVGFKDTYDISMKDEPRNFIAGNFVVHNCLKAVNDKGKTMTESYVDRKHGLEEITSVHPTVDDFLKETYGVIVYQEQAMKIAEVMAGFSLVQADDLRKAIGKKDAALMKEVREKFIDGCKNNRITEAEAIKVFDVIEKSSRYSFNKSHAFSYAQMAYWSAYLRYHSPRLFLKNWLKGADDKQKPHEEVRQLVISAKDKGINVVGPKINRLEADFFVEGQNIHYGICNVKNVGQSHLEQITNCMTDDHLHSWTKFLFEVVPHVNKRAIDSLIKVGAMDMYGFTRNELLHQQSCIATLTDKELEYIIDNIDMSCGVFEVISTLISRGLKKNGGGIHTESRLRKVNEIMKRLLNPGRSLMDCPFIYADIEEDLLGYCVNRDTLCITTEFEANTTCKQLKDGKRGKNITLIVKITEIKEITTKKSQQMAFVTIEDSTTEAEMVLFPKQYEKVKNYIYTGGTFYVCGETTDKKSLSVNQVFNI